MPVAASDMKYKFSVAAAAGNTTGGTANSSLGDQISTTEITDNVLNNLFDDVAGDENAASEAEYRCFFIHNAHATLSATNIRVYILSEVAGGAAVAIGVDPTAASAIGSGSAQAVAVATENDAPAGVAFTSPATLGAAISVGDLTPGQCRAVWVRRTAANSAALANDGGTLRVVWESL